MEAKNNVYNIEAANHLNQLLTTNYNAEVGYKNAAEEVKDDQLKRFFKTFSNQRYQFGHELKAHIKTLNEVPTKDTSLKGDLHRTWMSLKAAVSNEERETIIEECIRGEETALKNYEEIIESERIPPQSINTLKKHKYGIEEAIKSLNELK